MLSLGSMAVGCSGRMVAQPPCALAWRAVASTSNVPVRRGGSSVPRHEAQGRMVCRAKPNETPEEAAERRLRESKRVEERVVDIETWEDWERELKAAGDKLVVVEATSDKVCQTGLDEEAELHWKLDQEAALEPCVAIKHTFQRCARECPDVRFLSIQADCEEAGPLCDRLGIEVLPSLQFWRQGVKLWEHRGVLQIDQDLGEGVLYYGNTAGGGVKSADFVTELATKADLDKFVQSQDEKVLTVVNVSLTGASPCVHIFPAVLALAKNFVGYASFARLLGDASDEARALTAQLNVVQVPTFIFYRAGIEVGRHVGSSRGDLIGQILAQQSRLGIAPPPPAGAGTPRRRVSRAGSR